MGDPPVDPTAFGLDDRSGLGSAFAFSPLILCVTRLADGRLVDVNAAFIRATGYTRDELIGRRMEDLGLWIDPDVRAQGLEALREGRGVRDTEARFRSKHGDEIVAMLAAEAVTLDGEPCILTAAMDITDRVRAEEALRESEQRFLGAFHANPLPMTITSLPEGRHLEVNDAAVRHGGYTREELLGRTKLELGF
jgi:PAS domain S-box-containing protein